jgi:hypothetical protein
VSSALSREAQKFIDVCVGKGMDQFSVHIAS